MFWVSFRKCLQWRSRCQWWREVGCSRCVEHCGCNNCNERNRFSSVEFQAIFHMMGVKNCDWWTRVVMTWLSGYQKNIYSLAPCLSAYYTSLTNFLHFPHFIASALHGCWVRQSFLYDLMHTHTRLMAPCPGLHGWAGIRKVKTIWILLKQETVSDSGISWAMCKSAPLSRQITMPAPHCSVFYRPDGLAAAQPTESKHWPHSKFFVTCSNRLHLCDTSHVASQHCSDLMHVTDNPVVRILWAAETGNLDVVVEMLDKDASLIAAADADGYTPLHRASYEGHCQVVEVRIVWKIMPLSYT